ncbi:hypothetical protein C5167_032348 [Papaver somniferum]|uniref:Uncharacterized protein n=1 Tax=Papaver somniferum TaxID=3469 RepID=A0A4Y7K761_PAPSO|nr:hypothetical protein C5167_032348 [Papaver somniferum]
MKHCDPNTAKIENSELEFILCLRVTPEDPNNAFEKITGSRTTRTIKIHNWSSNNDVDFDKTELKLELVFSGIKD